MMTNFEFGPIWQTNKQTNKQTKHKPIGVPVIKYNTMQYESIKTTVLSSWQIFQLLGTVYIPTVFFFFFFFCICQRLDSSR